MGQNESHGQSPSHTQVQHNEPSPTSRPVGGITVVNPRPEDLTNSRDVNSLELEKLDKLPRFWPILKSTLDYEYPLESFNDGLSNEDVYSLCHEYRKHLSLIAQTTAFEQKSLASRMKDIEMFSAGIAQQLNRRQERIDKALPHLQSVNEISRSLDSISSLMASCVPLMNRINNLLPEQHRLEQLTIHSHLLSPTHNQTTSSTRLLQDKVYLRQDSDSSYEESYEETED